MKGYTEAEDRPTTVAPAGTTCTVALRCTDLVKSFDGRAAVDGISFEVRAGEAFGLLGPNGAGKSTTIRMVCGVLRPDGGSVEHLPAALEHTSPCGEPAIGYVPQELAIFPTLSLRQNLDFWARIFRVARRERRQRVEEALAAVGLLRRQDDRTDRTSGGMQRRLNLAVALLHRPSLLVLDEPTAGVDAQSRAAVVDTIGGLRDAGVAVLYTSHHLDEAERLCDRVGIMDAGRMLVEGEPRALVTEGGAASLYELFLDMTGRDLRD